MLPFPCKARQPPQTPRKGPQNWTRQLDSLLAFEMVPIQPDLLERCCQQANGVHQLPHPSLAQTHDDPGCGRGIEASSSGVTHGSGAADNRHSCAHTPQLGFGGYAAGRGSQVCSRAPHTGHVGSGVIEAGEGFCGERGSEAFKRTPGPDHLSTVGKGPGRKGRGLLPLPRCSASCLLLRDGPLAKK